MRTAIIILNYNDVKNTKRLSKTLNQYSIIDKIIVVDNCSPNHDFEKLQSLKNHKTDVIQSDKNGGYSYGNNFGLQYLEEKYGLFDYIIISNPDIEIEEDAIVYTIRFLEKHPDVALGAPRVQDLDGNKYLLSGWKFRNIYEDAVLQSEMLTRKYIKTDIMRLYSESERNQRYAYADCISGCFFIIKGVVFQKIGYFDPHLFIYGEEDIIGRKVHNLGYRAVVLNDVKVVHYESVSIKKTIRRRKQLKHLHKSLKYYYKHYDDSVTLQDLFRFDCYYYFGNLEFLVKNNSFLRKCASIFKKCIKVFQKSIQMFYRKGKKMINRYRFYHSHILKNGKKNILFVVHKWNDDIYNNQNIGGSLYTAIDILKNVLDDYNVLVMYPVQNCYHLSLYSDDGFICLEDGYASPNFSLKSVSYDSFVLNMIQRCHLEIVHIHSLIGHYSSIVDIAKEHGCKVIFSLHDFYPYCINYFLLNPKDRYCNLDVKQCKKCISRFCSYDNLLQWRDDMNRILHLSDFVIAPSEYLKNTFQKLYDNLSIQIIEHRTDVDKVDVGDYHGEEPLRIAFLGGISRIKGSELLKKLVDENQKKKSFLEIHLFGVSDISELNHNSQNYICHGEYKREELLPLLKKNKIHLTCIFSIIPETYSYTLSEAVLSGTPILAIDLGAVGERVRKNDIGWLISEQSSAKDILNILHKIKDNPKEYQLKRKNVKKYQLKIQDTRKMADQYRRLYEVNKKN